MITLTSQHHTIFMFFTLNRYTSHRKWKKEKKTYEMERNNLIDISHNNKCKFSRCISWDPIPVFYSICSMLFTLGCGVNFWQATRYIPSIKILNKSKKSFDCQHEWKFPKFFRPPKTHKWLILLPELFILL